MFWQQLKKRLTKSNNETLSIFISVFLGLVFAPTLFFVEGEGLVTLVYIVISWFGFVSAGSYLAKAIGKFIQRYKGEDNNLIHWLEILFSDEETTRANKTKNKTKKNIEGWAIVVAFVVGMAIALALLIWHPGSLSSILTEIFYLNFAQIMFVFGAGGSTASFASRFFRIFEQEKEERKKSFFYNLFVISAILLSAAAFVVLPLIFPNVFLLTAWPMIQLVASVFTVITVISTTVSLANYIGKVFDQIRHGTISNETLATIAGVGLGITLGVLIIGSGLATGGVGSIIAAVGFSNVLAHLGGALIAKIGFVCFWTSVTTGFCRRIGTLFDNLFLPGKTIFTDLFAERITVTHDLPLVLDKESRIRFELDIQYKEESSIQKIVSKLKQFTPKSTPRTDYQQFDSSNDHGWSAVRASCFQMFSRKKVKVVDEIEMQPLTTSIPSPSFQKVNFN